MTAGLFREYDGGTFQETGFLQLDMRVDSGPRNVIVG